MPHHDRSLLALPIQWLTRVVLRWPWTTVCVAVALAAGSLALTVGGLQFRTSRLDLLNPDSGYNQRWLAYLDEFGHDDDVVVVVDADRTELVTQVIDQLGREIEREGGFRQVLYRYEFRGLRGKGLHFQDEKVLEVIDGEYAQWVPVVHGQWSRLEVGAMLKTAYERLERAEATRNRGGGNGQWGLDEGPYESRLAALQHLHQLLTSIHAALQPSSHYISPWPHAVSDLDQNLPSDGYLLADQGRLGFILLRLVEENAGRAEALGQLRRLVADVQQQYPDVRIGLTGMPVLEHDEMHVSQSDMLRASSLSLLGVAVLFVAGFGGWRYPFLTVVCLLVGMAWSFAYITLSVGHLNILSISFGVILIGLGIDFGIHYVARYLQIRGRKTELRPALLETAGSVGPAVVTGGVTTAVAFFTATLTHFTGVAELGMIAGGGILLCVTAALFVLPALIFLLDRRPARTVTEVVVPVELIFRPILDRPRLALLFSMVPLGVFAGGVSSLQYDHNLLNLQPRRMESVDWERQLIERTDHSVWFALSMAPDREQLVERKRHFEALPSVQRVEEIVSRLPESDERRVRLIERIHQRLSSLPEDIPVLPVDASSSRSALVQIDKLLVGMEQFAPPARDGEVRLAASWSDPEAERLLEETRRLTEMVFERIDQLSGRDLGPRLTAFQQQAARELLAQMQQLYAVADPQPPTPDDLPPQLASRFIGASGLHLLKIYPRENIWDMDGLTQFVQEAERVDPSVTGHPVQTYYASRHMQQSYVHAAIYSLLMVAIILMLDFRSISATLLAMVPVGLGMLQLFGLLGLLGIPLNPANMIILPLILGIGIDDGVHVVHDYRRQHGKYRLGNSTATAIMITSATTMVGFGSLIFASHQGLRSLGQVLTLGVFCCLITSLVTLPAVLTLLNRWRLKREGGRLLPSQPA